jgi:sugar phosphate isomerase/epimerase
MPETNMNRRNFFASSAALAAGAALQPPAIAAAASERKFRLGCVTYNLLKDLDLEGVIRTLETAGYAAVELRTGHLHGVEPSLGVEERKRVRERFERSKIKLTSYGTTCEFQSAEPAERNKQIDLAKAFVDLARDTGAMGVKVRPNGFPNGVPRDTTIQNIGAGLREVGEYGQSKGIEIWMEVHGTGTQEPQASSDILHAAAHRNVGACWNSNPTDVQDGSVKRAFALLGPYIRSVHITELASTYPWREFFTLLRESGYERYTLAEVTDSKDLERFLRYYRALWEQLTEA